MTRRVNRLLFIALSVIVVTLYFGCTQPDDIVSPVSLTTLTLSAQLLPEAPDGMAYELWAVKLTGSDTVYSSMGKFDYNRAEKKFTDLDGVEREDKNVFKLNDDLFSYDWIAVSVEVNPDDDASIPGPTMLWDRVTNPSDDPIDLRFPYSDSMWYATCRYNMATVSDTNRMENAGVGLWFSTYNIRTDTIIDTIAFDSISIDTTCGVSAINGNADTIITVIMDILNPRIDTIKLVRGLDTIIHQSFQYDRKLETYTEAPYCTTHVQFWGLEVTHGYPLTYDEFTQDDFAFWDYTKFGWHYKGWVVSPSISDAGASVGSFTLPAWGYTVTGQDALPGYEGGIISTGTFDKIDEPDDDGARYAIGPRVPPYPGDEFFINLPNNAPDTLNLVPNPFGNQGVVFISLEPDNFVTDTTNFPLIIFFDPLPETPFDPHTESLDQNTMDGLINTNNPARGFPIIKVDIKRF
ncbi:MAG: hypothetical protein ABIJ12_12450 [bacterium]